MDNVHTLASYMRASRKPMLGDLFDDFGDIAKSARDEALNRAINEMDETLQKSKDDVVAKTAKKIKAKAPKKQQELQKKKEEIKKLEDEKKELEKTKKMAEEAQKLIEGEIKNIKAQKEKSEIAGKVVLGVLGVGAVVGAFMYFKG